MASSKTGNNIGSICAFYTRTTNKRFPQLVSLSCILIAGTPILHSKIDALYEKRTSIYLYTDRIYMLLLSPEPCVRYLGFSFFHGRWMLLSCSSLSNITSWIRHSATKKIL